MRRRYLLDFFEFLVVVLKFLVQVCDGLRGFLVLLLEHLFDA